MTTYTNRLLCGDSAQILKTLPDNLVKLSVTSPPYDDLRDYDGYSFDFETIAKELFRVTKVGGVLVWVVGDKVEDGSETGTSFKHALFFKQCGFKLWDTMIYYRPARFPDKKRYSQSFEYMFVFSKGEPETIHLIKDHKNKPDSHQGGEKITGARNKDGSFGDKKRPIPRSFSNRWNVWYISNGFMKSSKDEIAFEHPAIFPEELARDHIISWSNEGDLVLDPFAGSGTTLKMAKLNRRNYLGIEISPKYCEIIEKRLTKYNNQSIEVFCN